MKMITGFEERKCVGRYQSCQRSMWNSFTSTCGMFLPFYLSFEHHHSPNSALNLREARVISRRHAEQTGLRIKPRCMTSSIGILVFIVLSASISKQQLMDGCILLRQGYTQRVLWPDFKGGVQAVVLLAKRDSFGVRLGPAGTPEWSGRLNCGEATTSSPTLR